MTKKTICLSMIVKNEAHIIIDTLEHLDKYIKFDYWVINDNGSTDGTADLITKYFAGIGVPGFIDNTPWKDFGFNRTAALNAAYGKTDYIFVWDADDEICGDFQLPAELDADSYKFTFGNGHSLCYSRCQLFNNHLHWQYVGVLHEYPACRDQCRPPVDVIGNYYFISGRRGNRSKDPNKYLNDALTLEAAFLEAQRNNDPIHNRYAFYTAQSYNSCNRHEKAIEYYKKVLTLDNWLQEKYVSCFEIYDQYEKLKQEDEGLRYLVEAYRFDKRRVECIYRLIKYYCIKGLPEISYAYYTLIQSYYESQYDTRDLSGFLFAKGEEYSFYLPYYMVIVSERVKRYDTFHKMYQLIFKYGYLGAGAWWIHNLFFNIKFGISNLDIELSKDLYLEPMLTYVVQLRNRGIELKPEHYDNIDKIINIYRPSLGADCISHPMCLMRAAQRHTHTPIRVMLTITTCKRLALFRQTINSILRCWKDVALIDYFFCVDDNSSPEDRAEMQQAYPFFDFHMKTPDQKGHRESMNIIWHKLREIQPAYWIHMEDDWLYFKSENYITRGIQALDKYEDQDVHQVVFNRNYGLAMSSMAIMGGRRLEPGIWLHERTAVQGRNCAYWPHYSLQPSIVRTKVILELGDYSGVKSFFEREYADKYAARGYQTVFLDFIHSLHIGKQHWETDGLNAYALNGVGQFTLMDAK